MPSLSWPIFYCCYGTFIAISPFKFLYLYFSFLPNTNHIINSNIYFKCILNRGSWFCDYTSSFSLPLAGRSNFCTRIYSFDESLLSRAVFKCICAVLLAIILLNRHDFNQTPFSIFNLSTLPFVQIPKKTSKNL